MVKVVQDDSIFYNWVVNFLPMLFDPEFTLEPGEVTLQDHFNHFSLMVSISRLLTGLMVSWFILMVSTSPVPGVSTTWQPG